MQDNNNLSTKTPQAEQNETVVNPPLATTPSPQPDNIAQPTTQPAQEIQQPPKPKSKKKLLIILLVVLLLLVAGGVGAYFYLQNQGEDEPEQPIKQGESEEKIPDGNSFRITGVDYILEKALRVEQENSDDLLILSLRIEANTECPLTGGSVCGYDSRRFKLTDEDGFLMDRTGLIPPKDIKINPLSSKILNMGEKDRGDIEFFIPKDKNTFILSYSNSDGTETKQLNIKPETYDPISDWETYTNTTYNYSFKYPNDYSIWASELENIEEASNLYINLNLNVPAPGSMFVFVGENPDSLSFVEWLKDPNRPSKSSILSPTAEVVTVDKEINGKKWLDLSESEILPNIVPSGSIHWVTSLEDIFIIVGVQNITYTEYEETIMKILSTFKFDE